MEQTLPAGTWLAAPGGCTIGFAVEHVGIGTLRGRFGGYKVRLAVTSDGDAQLTGAVRVCSLALGDPGLTATARSAVLLDACSHPELRFASTAIRRDGDLVELDGHLVVKGRGLPVVATGLVTVAGSRLSLELETYVDRRQFGLDWNLARPGAGPAFGYEVKLEAALTLERAVAHPTKPSGAAP